MINSMRQTPVDRASHVSRTNKKSNEITHIGGYMRIQKYEHKGKHTDSDREDSIHARMINDMNSTR